MTIQYETNTRKSNKYIGVIYKKILLIQYNSQTYKNTNHFVKNLMKNLIKSPIKNPINNPIKNPIRNPSDNAGTG